MTLVKFSHDQIYLTSAVKQGVHGGSVNSIDTSNMGTAIKCVPVQEEGTTAGQDDRLLGVTIGGTDGENGRLQTNWPIALQTHGVAACLVDNNNASFNAGDTLVAAVDSQTIYEATPDTLANNAISSQDVGVVKTITFQSLASFTAANHLALENQYARIVGYALEDLASNSADNVHRKVLLRMGVYTTYATA